MKLTFDHEVSYECFMDEQFRLFRRYGKGLWERFYGATWEDEDFEVESLEKAYREWLDSKRKDKKCQK